MECSLVMFKSDGTRKDIPLPGRRNVVGRMSTCEVRIPLNSISREHCIIGIANDELLVTDLNSTNGTYIDDVRISRAAILPVGSVLRIGQVSMRHSVRIRTEAEGSARLGNSNRDEVLPAGRLAAMP